MSETPHWDETECDTRFAALYRAAARDEPSAALDAVVRAAARREVGAWPKPAGSPSSRSWRVPLSIAAVILLSVSLVTVMHKEAPEIAQPPRADTPSPENGSRKDMAAADRIGASVLSAPPPAKHASPEAFPEAAGTRKNKVAAPAEKPRASAEEEVRRDAAVFAEARQRPEVAKPDHPVEAAASAESAVREPARARVQATPAPMAQPVQQMEGETLAYVNLSPEKWLERIEELRKQGRLGEAKTSLAEFKQHYPDYPLPASLKDGIKP